MTNQYLFGAVHSHGSKLTDDNNLPFNASILNVQQEAMTKPGAAVGNSNFDMASTIIVAVFNGRNAIDFV